MRFLDSFKKKTEGLSGKEFPEPVYFKTRWGIHTFGMNFPIDCIVADGNMVVRRVKENLRPGRFFFWNPKFQNVMELSAGTVRKTETEISDIIVIKER